MLYHKHNSLLDTLDVLGLCFYILLASKHPYNYYYDFNSKCSFTVSHRVNFNVLCLSAKKRFSLLELLVWRLADRYLEWMHYRQHIDKREEEITSPHTKQNTTCIYTPDTSISNTPKADYDNKTGQYIQERKINKPYGNNMGQRIQEKHQKQNSWPLYRITHTKKAYQNI